MSLWGIRVIFRRNVLYGVEVGDLKYFNYCDFFLQCNSSKGRPTFAANTFRMCSTNLPIAGKPQHAQFAFLLIPGMGINTKSPFGDFGIFMRKINEMGQIIYASNTSSSRCCFFFLRPAKRSFTRSTT